MAAGDSSPFRRMSEPLRKGRSVRQRAKAIPHRIRGQIDVHVPLKAGLFEPFENVHGRFVERQRHLIWKIPIDLENHAHVGIQNETRTRVNGARAGRAQPQTATKSGASAQAEPGSIRRAQRTNANDGR